MIRHGPTQASLFDSAVRSEPMSARQSQRLRNKRTGRSWINARSDQPMCKLLHRLPAELRCMIYAYVLTPIQKHIRHAVPVKKDGVNIDLTAERVPILRPLKLQPVKQQDYYDPLKRPPKVYEPFSSAIPLLQLCQVIYDEAQSLSFSASVHWIAYEAKTGSWWMRNITRDFLATMTPQQIGKIKDLQLFLGLEALNRFLVDSEGKVRDVYHSGNPLAELTAFRRGEIKGVLELPLCPDRLTISIRYADWAHSFAVSYPPLQNFLANTYWSELLYGIRKFIIELELELPASHFFRETISQLSTYVFELGNDTKLVPKGSPRELEWIAEFEEKSDGSHIPSTKRHQRRVFLFEWRLRRTSEHGAMGG